MNSVAPAKYRLIVVTSWDDGYAADCVLAGWLNQLGLKGTFFLTTHLIDAENTDPCTPPVLLPQQVRWLTTAGHEIGGHRHSHQPLPELAHDARGLTEELRLNKTRLEEVVDRHHPVVSFAYPEGRCGDSPEERATIKEALSCLGYASARLAVGPGEVRDATPVTEVADSPFCCQTHAELGTVGLGELRAILDSSFKKAQSLGEPHVVHLYGHSEYVLLKCPSRAAVTWRSLRALVERGTAYDPEHVWFCTQRDLHREAVHWRRTRARR